VGSWLCSTHVRASTVEYREEHACGPVAAARPVYAKGLAHEPLTAELSPVDGPPSGAWHCSLT
jgi:hypothetical protein